MKSWFGPIETKVAAAGGIGGLITLLFSLAAQYHWFTPPGPQLTGLIITAASLLAGWIVPHTHRPQPARLGQFVVLDEPASTTTGPGYHGPVKVTQAAMPRNPAATEPPERTAP